MTRLPQPGERVRILPSPVTDRIGATGRAGTRLDRPGSVSIYVRPDDASGIRWEATVPKLDNVVACTISEVEYAEGEAK